MFVVFLRRRHLGSQLVVEVVESRRLMYIVLVNGIASLTPGFDLSLHVFPELFSEQVQQVTSSFYNTMRQITAHTHSDVILCPHIAQPMQKTLGMEKHKLLLLQIIFKIHLKVSIQAFF